MYLIASNSLKNIMKQLGLLGYPVSHSHSPEMINNLAIVKKWDCNYRSYAIKSGSLAEFISRVRDLPISGFNVTIPHKQAILNFCDEYSSEVKTIRAANTICNQDGKLIAYNTDVFGFDYGLKELLGTTRSIKNAIIVGAGGAARAAAYSLVKSGCLKLVIASRDNHRKAEWQRDFATLFSETNLSFCLFDELKSENIIQETDLIVQSTPIGMSPNENETVPFPFHQLRSNHLVFDLVYNPETTKFLQLTEQHGAKIQNGLSMLAAQAAKSLGIWGFDIEVHEVVEVLKEQVNKKEKSV